MIIALFVAEWWVVAIAAGVLAVTGPMAIWLAKMAESAMARFRSDPLSLFGHFSWPSMEESTGVEIRPPFAIVFASTLPPMPLVARVLLALWWLAHFLAGAALVVFRNVVAQQVLLWPGFADGVPAVVFAYLFHVAANLFLILAVTAAFGSPAVTATVWRHRFVIDALFTLPLLLQVVL